MTGRHIIGRARMERGGHGYTGRLTLWGFSYEIEIARTSDGVELIAYEDAKPVISPEYRIPALDDAK